MASIASMSLNQLMSVQLCSQLDPVGTTPSDSRSVQRLEVTPTASDSCPLPTGGKELGIMNQAKHVGLELPTSVEYDHGDAVVHPEQAQVSMVPSRNLTSATATLG